VVRLQDRRVADPDVPLAGPTWTVVSIIDGDAVSSVPNGTTATILFHADGTVSVNAGCNEGQATWAAVAGGIRFSALGLTKKACPGAAGELESAVVAVLTAGDVGATIEAKMLTLVAGGRGLQLSAS
jgi:heat shock protein HslJ